MKNSKLFAIFSFRCPRCYKGRLFVKKNTYSSGFAEMNKRCLDCDLGFMPEPGFYFGAAYVSYALTVALWVALFVALTMFNQWGVISFSLNQDTLFFMISGVVLLIVLLPFIYRLSRSLWIHTFVKREKLD